jgi:nitrate reductase cytochrome c-type subunit
LIKQERERERERERESKQSPSRFQCKGCRVPVPRLLE